MGGELELIVRLPSHPPLRLTRFADAFSPPADA
jgi:hypothetical protein